MLTKIILGILLFVAVWEYPRPPHFDCSTHKQIAKFLMMNGQGLAFTAIVSNGTVIQLYLNGNSREWTIIAIDEDLGACEALRGYGLAMPGEIAI